MKLSLTFLFWIIIFTSCNRKNDFERNKNYSYISPDDISFCQVTKYSDLFDSIRFIKLETMENCIIGNIDKLIYHKNRFYILDRHISKSVLIFDDNGKFIGHAGKIGRGPGEFMSPYYIDINAYTDQLIIYDNYLNRLLLYSLNGDFQTSILLKNRFDAFSVIDANKYSLYYNYFGSENINELPIHNLHIIDEHGKILYKAFDRRDSKLPNNNSLNNFCKIQNQVLFNPSFDHRIYSIMEGDISVKYEIDLGDKSLTEDLLIKFTENGTDRKKIYDNIQNSDKAFIKGFYETLNFLLINISFQGRIHNVFYSKTTGNIITSAIYINDMYGLIPASNNMFGFADDIIVSYINPWEIPLDYYKELLTKSLNDKDYIRNELLRSSNHFNHPCSEVMDSVLINLKFEHTRDEVQMIQDITTNANPILLIHKIKKF